MSNIQLFFRAISLALKCVLAVAIFFPIYVICCPYFLCDNPADEDYYLYLADFDDFL